MRFFAIASVVVYHINEYVTRFGPVASSDQGMDWLIDAVCGQGFVGVHLFFAISGFILALPFAEHFLNSAPPVKLRRYFTRRVTRLEPPYLINLVVMYMVFSVAAGKATEMLPHLMGSAMYLHSLGFGERSAINGVAWSLEVEIQFYLLAPLLGWIYAIGSSMMRRVILVAAIVCLAVQDATLTPPLDLTILHHLQYFLVGFLLADCYLSEWRTNPDRSWRWDGVGTVAWFCIPLVVYHQFLTYELMPLLIFLAYGACMRGRVWPWIARQPALVAIGGMCYTIYLYHFLCYWTVGAWSIRHTFTEIYWVNQLLQITLLSAVTVVACSLLYLLFEKPFMRPDWPGRAWAMVRRGISGGVRIDRTDPAGS